MRHLVVSRFTVGLYEYKYKKIPGSPDLDQYIDIRVKLCKRFTEKSILAQSDQDFEWLLLISPDTPPSHQKLINDVLPYEQVKVSHEKMLNIDFDVMTKLDNDDVISLNYVEEINSLYYKIDSNLLAIEPATLYMIKEDGSACNERFPSVHREITPGFIPSIFSVFSNLRWIHPYLLEHHLMGNVFSNIITLRNAKCGRISHSCNLWNNLDRENDTFDFFDKTKIRELLLNVFGVTCG